MVAKLALDVILASFFHCRLTIELLNISDPTEKFNAFIHNNVKIPWPYMVITHPWPDDMNSPVLDNKGQCILHIFLTTNGKISQAAPGLHWWAAFIMHQTYYLSIRVIQRDSSLSPWRKEFRAAELLEQPRMLENWALLNVIHGSTGDYIVEEISAMYFYCSRIEVICLKKVLLSTPHDQLRRQMFPLSWPAGFFDYKQWPIHFLTPDEWLLKGESKVDELLHPPPFRLLPPKGIYTGHIFGRRELADLLFHFNASLTISWDLPEYAPMTLIRMEMLGRYLGGYFVFHEISKIGFVYCNDKTSPYHSVDSIASPLDWPTWACAAGTYVTMCAFVRMISGQWEPLNLLISLLAQGATICLKRFHAVWLLWIITAIFFGWFFTSSIEALLVSPTLPTGINDMEGLFNNGYTLVMDAWSDEGRLATHQPEFMSETACLRALKSNLLLAKVWNIYDQYFLQNIIRPKLALVLQPGQAQVLLIVLQKHFNHKQCFGNPNALNTYAQGMMSENVNGRMVTDVAIRLRAGGFSVWYEKNAARSLAYEWTLRLSKSLQAAFPDQVKDIGRVSEWNDKDKTLEGFHRTTDGNELRALLAICSTALALAFVMFIMEVRRRKIHLVSAKLSALLKSVWAWAFGL